MKKTIKASILYALQNAKEPLSREEIQKKIRKPYFPGWSFGDLDLAGFIDRFEVVESDGRKYTAYMLSKKGMAAAMQSKSKSAA